MLILKMGQVVSKAKEFIKDIPIIGDLFEGVEDAVGAIVVIGRILLSFLTELDNIINLGLSVFNLGKEMISGLITYVKSLIDLLLNSLDLISHITDMIEFSADLTNKYINIPFAFIYFIPFFIGVKFLTKLVEIIS